MVAALWLVLEFVTQSSSASQTFHCQFFSYPTRVTMIGCNEGKTGVIEASFFAGFDVIGKYHHVLSGATTAGLWSVVCTALAA